MHHRRFPVRPCLLLLATVLGCGPREGKTRLAEGDRLPRLETVEPALQSVFAVQIELSATVEALEKVDLCARVPGLVEVLHPDIDIGLRVRAGEKLIQLAVPDLEAQKKYKEALLEQARRQKLQAAEAITVATRELQEAEAQDKRYAAETAFRKLELERVSELVRRGAQQPERVQESQRQFEATDAAWQAARAQIETKRAKVRAAEADLQVADSRIRVAEAEVQNLGVLIGYATLTAPFDGVITKRWVDRGATVKDAAAPLLTLMRTDVVRVVLDIPERDVPLVRGRITDPKPDGSGTTVELTLPALRSQVAEGKFRGTIARLASALDPVTRTMRAEVHLDNGEGHLRPGMYGTATVLLDERANVLTVPSTALVRKGNKVELFHVADLAGDPPRGVVRRAQVELGLDDGVRVEVRGLSGRERIIAKGNGVVREGDAVIAVPAREP
jgi:RND family efflux transporter MFP subunit